MTARLTQQLKASQYSTVFNLVLKTVTDVQVRMSVGSESIGAVWQMRRHIWQKL